MLKGHLPVVIYITKYASIRGLKVMVLVQYSDLWTQFRVFVHGIMSAIMLANMILNIISAANFFARRSNHTVDYEGFVPSQFGG